MSERCDKHDREKVPLEVGHGRPPLMICEKCAEEIERWLLETQRAAMRPM